MLFFQHHENAMDDSSDGLVGVDDEFLRDERGRRGERRTRLCESFR
jgi:hypothetical protein